MTDARDALRAYEMQPQHDSADRSRGQSAPLAFDALRSLLDFADNQDQLSRILIPELAAEKKKIARRIREIVKEALSDD